MMNHKGPAPVLPAMGLHSFHADSPPFAGAGMPSEPDHLSLTDAAAGVTDGTHPLGQHQEQYIDDETADAELSRARSRRLVSGYRFGNPPSPIVGMRAKNAAALDADVDADSVTEDVAPSNDSDSPPLTEPEGSPVVGSEEIEDLGVDVQELVVSGNGSATTLTALSKRVSREPEHRAASSSSSVNLNPGPLSAPLHKSAAARRRSERSRFDALTGLHDGEADADASAPQAEQGSEPYLRGEASYGFPKHRLRKTMKDESKIPLVIVACGSFSPPTYLHLRMFEMAKDEILESQTYEIMAGYYSPVSSYYKKAGLAPAIDRVRMCELAVEHTSTWLMVDPWEAGQPEYQRTAVVLDHFDEMCNGDEGGVYMADGSRRKYKIMLLAGGDLIESFGEPGVWSEPDLHIILGRFGCLIVERAGSDVWAFLLSHDILYHHRRNVIVIKQLIYNDISSTKVRLFVRRGMSIKYLLPNSVIQYIHEHKLYRESDRKPLK